MKSRSNTRFVVRLIASAVMSLGIGATWATAQPVSAQADVPPVPPSLEVPAGHTVFLAGYAEGTQNYICLPATTGVVWRFVGPQATLFRSSKDDPRKQITTHFLSVNPVEGLARPTWQHSDDSSRVWGRVSASSNDSNFIEPGAIPWLLVEAAGVDAGPTSGKLAQTTFIHRLNTSGGIAPTSGCSDVTHIGTLALVPYTTDYFFYRATH
jgi:hypothetical protein